MCASGPSPRGVLAVNRHARLLPLRVSTYPAYPAKEVYVARWLKTYTVDLYSDKRKPQRFSRRFNCADIIIEKTTVPVKTAKALEHEARPTQEAITFWAHGEARGDCRDW